MVDTNKTIPGGEYTPSLLNIKKLGEQLTPEEFNAIIYLLKKNTVLNEVINIQNNKITGKYGNYIFNLDSTTITDQGILITNQTLDNLGSVKLVDPLFEDSRYTLFLTVMSMKNLNIGLTEDIENIEVSEISIDLEKDVDVIIPFDKLDFDYIVKFSGMIVITHDIPEIN